MNYSQTGLQLTESSEGCKLDAYLDGGGVPTIGFGHTKGVYLGMTCSQLQAEAWLLEDVQHAVGTVNSLVKVPLTQNQFDALVDFVFNLGSGAFNSSTLLRKLNAGDYAGANAEFGRWNHDNGKTVAGLTRRRAAEAALFAEEIQDA
jgi:lysozyme